MAPHVVRVQVHLLDGPDCVVPDDPVAEFDLEENKEANE